jgi:hypothetical protein
LSGSGAISDVVAGICENEPLPQIEIAISKSEIREVHDMTAVEIKRLAEATGKRLSWPGLGASSANMAYGAKISETAGKEQDGSYCATPTYIYVLIALRDRVIHLAQELKEEPCLEQIQREHLLKLAHADEQALDQFPIETEMRRLLGQLRPSKAESELAARARATTAVRKGIQAILDKIENHTFEIHRRINAQQEIARLRSAARTYENCR